VKVKVDEVKVVLECGEIIHTMKCDSCPHRFLCWTHKGITFYPNQMDITDNLNMGRRVNITVSINRAPCIPQSKMLGIPMVIYVDNVPAFKGIVTRQSYEFSKDGQEMSIYVNLW